MHKSAIVLEDDILEAVIGGTYASGAEVSGDTQSLRFEGKSVPLPPAGSKKEDAEDGIKAFCPVCHEMQIFRKAADYNLHCSTCGTVL